MTTLETIGVITAIGTSITAVATGLNYLIRAVSKPKLRYRIDDITDKGHLNVNRGDSGNEDLGKILGKSINVENVGNRPAEKVTIHVRTNSRLMPQPVLATNLNERSIDVRPSEVYVHAAQVRAKGGRLILSVFVLENDLKLLGKSEIIADFEVSHSYGRAKRTRKLKYIKKVES